MPTNGTFFCFNKECHPNTPNPKALLSLAKLRAFFISLILSVFAINSSIIASSSKIHNSTTLLYLHSSHLPKLRDNKQHTKLQNELVGNIISVHKLEFLI